MEYESELYADPEQDDQIDDLNDDTFADGDTGKDWEPPQNQFFSQNPREKLENLPDFFKFDSTGDDLDGGLEPLGEETLDSEEQMIPIEGNRFSTANPRAQDESDYFFIDDQLENQLDHLTEDDEEQRQHDQRYGQRNSFTPSRQQQQSFTKDWSEPFGKSPGTGSSIWGIGSGSTTNTPQKPNIRPVGPPGFQDRQHHDQPENVLQKFFGGAVPSGVSVTQNTEFTQGQTQQGPRVSGVLSVEELEARLRGARVSNTGPPPGHNVPPAIPQSQGHPAAHPSNFGQNPQMNSHVNPHGYPMNNSGIPPTVHRTHAQPIPSPLQQFPSQQPYAPPNVVQQPKPEPVRQSQQTDAPIFSNDQFPALSRDPQPTAQSSQSAPQQVSRNANIVAHQQHFIQKGFATSPNRQGGFNQHNNRPQNNFTQQPGAGHNQQYRTRWRENKEMMSAFEIDSIIRMQEMQLLSGNNSFAEDFYFIKRSDSAASHAHHKPLYESNTKMAALPSKKNDPLEGVLGRIPSHSVRAPRPLLQLKQLDAQDSANRDSEDSASANTSSKAIQNLLLNIETAFQLVIDIEDIDNILKSSDSNTHFNVAHVRSKREDLTHELYRSLHVQGIPIGYLPQKVLERDPDTNILTEDENFISWTLVHKGRKLIVRALPVLYQDHVINIFFLYLRNFAALVASPRLEMDLESTNKLFALLFNIVTVCSVPHVIMAMQVILISHNEVQLIKILQSKFGLPIIQALMKRAHDLNLSFFSREDKNIPIELQQSPLAGAGYHWRDTVRNLMQRMTSKWNYIFQSDIGRTNRIWEFFAVLVINTNVQEKQNLLGDLREIIMNTPMNGTLSAFLKLAGISQ